MIKRFIYILIAATVAHGSVIRAQGLTQETFKIGKTLALLDAVYIDSVNISELTEKMIISTLKDLDPHSVYIPAKDVQEENEPLLGNFEGIGVQFNILNDTILIISPTSGGPSEKVGILSGDRIINIDGEKVTGIGLNTAGVRKRLMGPKGTIVVITVFRRGVKDLLEFTIVRDKIPVNSLDAAYMISGDVGYIKLSRFSEQTAVEFDKAVEQLKLQKMANLIIDLRGNSGGYMVPAVQIVDQLLASEELIVYLEGRHTSRQEYNSSTGGSLTGARISVLIDEGSASASEILAGAVQDWDRGVIVGRRSFGKGLVQNGFTLPDGSEIRITIARYYTPSGRSIQTPYNDGFDKYIQKYYSRYMTGELMHPDSLNLPDSLRSYTLMNRRNVFGGGGITPDVFVPIDTNYYSDYYRDLIRTSTLQNFVISYTDQNRKALLKKYKTFSRFEKEFSFTEEAMAALREAGEKNKIAFDQAQYNISAPEMTKVMKGLVARDLWDMNEYFRIVNRDDTGIKKALSIINDLPLYRKILGYKEELQ
ncbi:MAG TPA: S41 family peptidase [Bacteroidales bacterium]|nr:S41 family peptidase [Bacteroidales bacterium]